MKLTKYNQKRAFEKTPEPKGALGESAQQLHFVVQKHDASRLHYDFRLELDGVLLSWAVPKGPSLNPADKRLAMMTEDHPLSYMTFEGAIPEGNYGAGDVIVWDLGLYMSAETSGPEESRKKLKAGFHKGEIKFVLYGHKLKGAFALVKMKGRDKNAWLLVKERDEYASEEDVTARRESVLTGRLLPRDARERPDADPMPHDIAPMLARLEEEPFDRPGWLFEIKWDGYRAIAEKRGDDLRLYSRNGVSFLESYRPVVEALEGIEHDVVLDGEIIALKGGMPDFHALQQYADRPAPLQYVLFDLLWADGEDLRERPLRERKERLRELLPENPRLVYSEHVEGYGTAFFKAVCERGIEGMIAKDAESRYEAGRRSGSWRKVKTRREQEAVIVGFTQPRGSRKNLGALVLAAHEGEGGALRYIGHSGGGFTQSELADLCRDLAKLKTATPPIAEKVPVNSPITWVKPRYVAQIQFTDWTPDGRMRHPIYKGMRRDKKPEEVVKEGPERRPPARRVHAPSSVYTHLDKVFWPEEGYTKGDVLDYYERMAPVILPYLIDRLENLNRHPNGISGKSFYQKNVTAEVPDFVETKKIWSESNQEELRYVLCQNEETLLYLANLGCIELNPWNSRVGSLERPDYMVIDLDPGTNTFDELIEVAQEVHRVLDLACQESYPKTSGKTGLHIYVPLGAKYPYDDIRAFARLIATIVHRRLPDLTSIERDPRKRADKIYLDYLQNRYGQTLAAPYSLRPTPGAPVSAPLEWKEVRNGLDPRDFTIRTIGKRLEEKGDLWKPVLTRAIDLRASLARLEQELGKA